MPSESEILTNEEQTKFGLAVLVNPKLQKLILKCNYTGTEDHGDVRKRSIIQHTCVLYACISYILINNFKLLSFNYLYDPCLLMKDY